MTFQTYNNNVPNPPNSPKVDVPQMNTNTMSISALITQDHFGFNNNAGGFHKQVHLNDQSAPGLNGPDSSSDGVLYSNTGTDGNSWPFWQNLLGSIQLGGQNFIGANGYITLPSRGSQPLIVQWGIVNGTHGPNNLFNALDSNTVTFATANIAFPNNCFVVLANGNWKSAAGSAPTSNFNLLVDQTTLSNLKFDWIVNTNSNKYSSFFWVAIGN